MVGERIKAVRLKLGMNQVDFGKSLDLSQSAIANYEKGVRAPIDAVLKLICDKYNVNPEWLRTGEGEPFRELGREEQIADYFRDLEGLNEELKKRLVSALAAIGEDDWKIIRDLVEKIVRDNTESAGSEPPSADPDPDFANLPPDEQELVRQYREKKLPAGGSGATAAG